MFDLKSFVYLPNVSESHYSFLTTFLGNSFFIKFDELEIFLFFYYSSYILENKNKNKFNLLHVDFFFLLSQLCLIYFYFKSKNNWLFLLLIKASMRKEGKSTKFKKKTTCFFSLILPEFFTIKNKEVYFFLFEIRKNFLFSDFLFRIRNTTKKLDIIDIIILKSLPISIKNFPFERIFVKFIPTFSSFCALLPLIRNYARSIKCYDFLNFITLKKAPENHFKSGLYLQYTLQELILKFLEKKINKFNEFPSLFYRKRKNFNISKGRSTKINFLFLGILIFRRNISGVNWKTKKIMFTISNCYCFYSNYIFKKKNSLYYLENEKKLSNFYQNSKWKYIASLFFYKLSLNKELVCEYIRYRALKVLFLESIQHIFTNYYRNQFIKFTTITLFSKIFPKNLFILLSYFFKDSNFSKIILRIFLSLSCLENDLACLKLLETNKNFFKILYTKKKRKKICYFLLEERSLNIKKRKDLLLNKHNLVHLFFSNLPFFGNSLIEIKLTHKFFFAECRNFYRIFKFSIIKKKKPNKYLKIFILFLIEKFKKKNHFFSCEIRNEFYKNNILFVSETCFFSNFLKKEVCLFLSKDVLFFFLSIKDFLVNILWDKKLKFQNQTIYFKILSLNLFLKYSTLVKIVFSIYFKNWHHLGLYISTKQKIKNSLFTDNIKLIVQKFTQKSYGKFGQHCFFIKKKTNTYFKKNFFFRKKISGFKLL